MSKILKISKHKLDLARVELTGPSILIGRSPMCDQVLRAPGIKPVHFLLEWVGEGEFDSSKGMWTLFDMGHLVSGPREGNNISEFNKNDLAIEGIVIDKIETYLGLNWEIVEDRFQASHIQKGIITNQLMVSVKKRNVVLTTKLALEIVSMNQKEQKVQEIWHFFEQKIDSFKRTKVIPFNLIWSLADQVQIDFITSPKTVLNLKGQVINVKNSLILYPQETLIIHFQDDIFFVRFISRVDYVPVKEHFYKNKFWASSCISLFIFCLLLMGVKQKQKSFIEPESKSIIRVVKIFEPPTKAPVVEVTPTSAIKNEPEKKIELAIEEKAKAKPKSEIILTSQVKNFKIESSAASTFKTEAGKETIGLNAPAKVSDINAVGLLGKIKNKGAQVSNKQISAESINQTFVDSTTSGADQKGVQIQVAPIKIVGLTKNSNAESIKGEETGSNLMEAQTTLKGAKDFSANNSGLLAHSQGLKGVHTIGVGTNGEIGANLSNINSLSDGKSSPNDPAEVSGGLTKSQVYSVINSHRREIRTCFESALLVRNDLNGILRMSFSINIEGFVTEVKVVNSEIDSSILERCVIQVIRQMNFPQTPNQLPSSVIYPFVFKRVK